MAVLHFEENALNERFNAIEEEDISGKFHNWKKEADYFVELAIILQLDQTNVSEKEMQLAPNITFLSVNQAIINIYRTFSAKRLSFKEFETEYLQYERSVEIEVKRLRNNLNTARSESGLMGEWYINYSLNDRRIEISKSG